MFIDRSEPKYYNVPGSANRMEFMSVAALAAQRAQRIFIH